MKTKKLLALAAVVAVLVAFALVTGAAGQEGPAKDAVLTATTTDGAGTVNVPEAAETSPEEAVLRHRQEVWLYALEWCESGGVKTAVNWYDLDGTASYYSFQFKPGTFRYYGEKYGVIQAGLTEAELMEALKSYDLQRAIVKAMMEDGSVVWTTQFPACVRKLGLPPRG